MKKLILIFLITIVSNASSNGCLKCHNGIEHIRAQSSQMMKEILDISQKAGEDNNDCIVCHGGRPQFKTKFSSHSGTVKYFLKHDGPKEFYPDPGSPWINKNTCGMCHKEQVSSQYNSLMMSESGKIQGALWGFGGKNGYKHTIGTYDTQNPKDLHSRLGSAEYKDYMQKLSQLEENAFPQSQKTLIKAPSADEVEKDPSLAVYTYLRTECLRCHTGMSADNRGSYGDYRGVGCSSCHMPYSNSGMYEGSDKSIRKDKIGYPIVHSMQATREAKVSVNGHQYSGIPVETCTTCHNRGKRIGVSYQGLMETEFNSPYQNNGANQSKLHGKKYLHLKSDIHLKKGMLCQDCHTSNDAHGDNFLAGTNGAAVEIECQDCHGTTSKYPWELPLGYSDEFGKDLSLSKARGVTYTLEEYLKKGTQYDVKGGYILSARGNPLGNAVRVGNEIVVHLSSGKDITLKPLKKLKDDEKLSINAMVAMDTVKAHTDKLECYSCHATWAPQCYGCHVKVDYSKGKQSVDWLKASHDQDIHGTTGDMRGNLRKYMVDGKVTETRSYMRWEDPALSINGEGRVSPTVPGCQTTITVIGKDGNTLLSNHIYKIPNVEGAGEDGQLGIDMAPIQPHTIQKEARECESCHTSDKALGLGIGGGKFFEDQTKDFIVDLSTITGDILSTNAKVRDSAIPNLNIDYSKFVDNEGNQLQTVGHHFTLSRAFSKKEMAKIDRRGVCFSCHQNIPDGDLAVSMMSHIAEVSGITIDNKLHQSLLSKSVKLTAWVQISTVILVIIGLFVYRQRQKEFRRKRKYI